MAGLEVEVFAVVIDLADLVWVGVAVVLGIRVQRVICPRPLPESFRGTVSDQEREHDLCSKALNSLVHDSHIFVGLEISFVMINGVVQTNRLEGGLFPRRHNIPPNASLGQVVES